jgi:hypothetical protein
MLNFRSRSVLPYLVVLLLSPISLRAETAKSQAPNQDEESAPTATAASALKITLASSREQVYVGKAFGIRMRLENVSDKPIYFTPRAFSLMAPPELDPNAGSEWYFLFPLTRDPDDQTNWQTSRRTPICLMPNSSIVALAKANLQNPATPGLWKRIKDSYGSFGFSPGIYTLNVTGRYWDSLEGAIKNTGGYTQSDEIQQEFAEPWLVILVGAMVGGAFAYWLVWRSDPSLYSGWAHETWLGAISALVLSVMVTILLARLSDANLMIRVTVNDFWGAMAVGFVGAAAGPTVLTKFTSYLDKTKGANVAEGSDKTQTEEPTAKPQPVPGLNKVA